MGFVAFIGNNQPTAIECGDMESKKSAMSKGLTNQDWQNDDGRPAYVLPLIVDAPDGKRDISEWAAKEVRFDFWLALRSGSKEWNARMIVDTNKLKTLEHGKTYNTRDLIGYGVDLSKPFSEQPLILGLPEKVQFIVEDLRSEYSGDKDKI